MSLLKRLGYYLGGFSVGLVILAFILSQKNFSCSYGPNARVLKNIRLKEKVYSEEATQALKQKLIDTASIRLMLLHGDVDFSRSDTKAEPCRYYFIDGYTAERKEVTMKVENCDSIATIQQFYFKE